MVNESLSLTIIFSALGRICLYKKSVRHFFDFPIPQRRTNCHFLTLWLNKIGIFRPSWGNGLSSESTSHQPKNLKVFLYFPSHKKLTRWVMNLYLCCLAFTHLISLSCFSVSNP